VSTISSSRVRRIKHIRDGCWRRSSGGAVVGVISLIIPMSPMEYADKDAMLDAQAKTLDLSCIKSRMELRAWKTSDPPQPRPSRSCSIALDVQRCTFRQPSGGYAFLSHLIRS